RACRAGAGPARAGAPRPRRPRPPLARGATATRPAPGDRAGGRARAALGAARLGRDLRPARARLDPRHVRGAGAGRGGGADRGRDAAGGGRARRRGGEAARPPGGVGRRRPARDRRPRPRHGRDPARRQDRRPGQRVRERGEAARLPRGRDRPAGGPVRGGRRARARRRSASRRARACGAGRARPRRGLCDRRGGRPRGGAGGGGAARARARRPARRGGDARAADPERRRGLRRLELARSERRPRHGRQPRPADGRLGALGGRTRARDLPQAGDGAAAHARWARPRPADGGGAGGRGGAARARGGGAAMRALADDFAAYAWAPSTEELARRAGLDPVEIVRFDGNVPALPLPSSRPGALAAALAEINTYPHGGYTQLEAAIARYAGVEPANVVLGAGADDLILLVARTFAGPGDTVAIPPPPTYPLFRVGALLAGATIGDDDPALA